YQPTRVVKSEPVDQTLPSNFLPYANINYKQKISLLGPFNQGSSPGLLPRSSFTNKPKITPQNLPPIKMKLHSSQPRKKKLAQMSPSDDSLLNKSTSTLVPVPAITCPVDEIVQRPLYIRASQRTEEQVARPMRKIKTLKPQNASSVS